VGLKEGTFSRFDAPNRWSSRRYRPTVTPSEIGPSFSSIDSTSVPFRHVEHAGRIHRVAGIQLSQRIAEIHASSSDR
jgi:hypothetical protein